MLFVILMACHRMALRFGPLPAPFRGQFRSEFPVEMNVPPLPLFLDITGCMEDCFFPFASGTFFPQLTSMPLHMADVPGIVSFVRAATFCLVFSLRGFRPLAFDGPFLPIRRLDWHPQSIAAL